MLVSLLNSLLLKEEFIQRSGFTSEPPIVAAATFSQISGNFGPSFFILFAPLCYVFGLFEAYFLLFDISFGSMHGFWTVRLSSLLCLSLSPRSLLENRPHFLSFRKEL